MMFRKQFGGKFTSELEEQYRRSPNWQNGRFQNLEETSLSTSLWKLPGIIYKQLTSRNEKEPPRRIPVLPFDQKAFLNTTERAKFIWYGHSAVLLRINGQSLLIDPMLGPDTTPIAPMSTRRFSDNTLSFIDKFPDIDVLLLTHDHYDHLDFASIQKLKSKVKKYFVALGTKRHLVSWGIAPELITEFDWWDTKTHAGIDIIFTPTRHFSGRGLTDRMKSLWGGWAFKTAQENIWFSGDGGYGAHFHEVGKRLGPFDFAFMECGQYNEDWRPVHLFPDESVRAALDAGVKKAMPVHWAGFALSYQHSWREPAEDFVKAADKQQLDFAVPQIGELFEIGAELKREWWLDV